MRGKVKVVICGAAMNGVVLIDEAKFKAEENITLLYHIGEQVYQSTFEYRRKMGRYYLISLCPVVFLDKAKKEGVI